MGIPIARAVSEVLLLHDISGIPDLRGTRGFLADTGLQLKQAVGNDVSGDILPTRGS